MALERESTDESSSPSRFLTLLAPLVDPFVEGPLVDPFVEGPLVEEPFEPLGEKVDIDGGGMELPPGINSVTLLTLASWR